ncbi:hypothetical protein SAMN05444507_11136 [Pseudomonas syringae]|uniref:hypothetical protein n=1 Tax=Pseudomonas syringae TaxID=317 RepID=UPI0008EAFC7F|nr:hypothetical protein [Pseudomonas syringae]SFI77453.1 hypothetical protein SAMN05444507_11136 [Pseudomonas syringae]
MIKQLHDRASDPMGHDVIALGPNNLAELEVIERLAETIGVAGFAIQAQRLAELHKIDPTAPVQSITRCTHPTQIGMTDGPFEVLSNLCEQLIAREPSLLERLSYRSLDIQRTALPLLLWFDLVRYARECFDPAALDAQFLVAKLKEGLSSKEAFDALIASKRRKS